MSVPTFDQMRKCIAPVWRNRDYEADILWAGVFGSVSRNRAHKESDVDILIVLKEHELTGEPVDLRENLADVCGREISLMCIWQGPDWAWGHVRVEALLSSRTVYGNRADIEHLRQQAVDYLEKGAIRLDLIAEAVETLKLQVARSNTYEEFVNPTKHVMRQECVTALRKVVSLLNIHPLHHPIRTMLVPLAFENAEKIRPLLDEAELDVTLAVAPVWRKIWDSLQPRSPAMWAFDAGCSVGGRKYIRHIMASKKLADAFEEGGEIAPSMYSEIIR